jgi:Phage integrase family
VGGPTGPNDHLVQNVRGGRLSRQRAGEIVKEAAELATERMLERGLPPMPRVTPHSLRRTYISIALLANNFDVKWVMSQVGHSDSKMTMDVYAQLEQRVKRSHGTSFDRLVRQARKLRGGDETAVEAAQLAPKRHRPPDRRFGSVKTRRPVPNGNRREQARREMARPGIEPGTPRFSVVCSTN